MRAYDGNSVSLSKEVNSFGKTWHMRPNESFIQSNNVQKPPSGFKNRLIGMFGMFGRTKICPKLKPTFNLLYIYTLAIAILILVQI